MNRKRTLLVAVAGFLAIAFDVHYPRAEQLLKTTFFQEPASSPSTDVGIGADRSLLEGKLFVRDSLGNYRLIQKRTPPLQAGPSALPARGLTTGSDVYVSDGSETAIASGKVVYSFGGYDCTDMLVAGFNTGWPFPVDSPHVFSSNFLAYSFVPFCIDSWYSPSAAGSGIFTGLTFDPWLIRGNSRYGDQAGGSWPDFFAMMMRFPPEDPFVGDSSHVIIYHSTDAGYTFSIFFEKMKDVFQDKPAIDIDRAGANGGGAGTVYDGKIYLGYDDNGPTTSRSYKGSFLQVVSAAGAAETEIQISSPASFRGRFLQPVAGVTDGTVYVKGHGFLSGYFGGTVRVYFHEITNGGAGPNTFTKSTITYSAAGQRLGTSPYSGLNGHRTPVNIFGHLDIDNSSGPRRGYLYFISNRNPNPANTALDQGDVYLSVSTNGATSWSSAVIPTASGKTQYMPMMDVDEQGWIHVAYYQNETGSVNGGVLNASTANLYYTVSIDGGTSWTLPVQVNDPANSLDYEDPPPDRDAAGWYLIGDYAQLAASPSGAYTTAYILWTGYDKDRSDTLVGDTKARVYCTTVQSFPQCQNDVEPPVINCPVDIATPADSGQCTAVVNFQAPATDNCPLFALACDPPSGSAFPIGVDTVVCIASDPAGNADTCSFTVAVSASVAKGDMNADGNLTSADVVLLVNCVFLEPENCGLCVADGNCSGNLTGADIVQLLQAVFSQELFPC